uniref:HDC14943 n=1 Tax=Drosophila melanogaster TaxID=7227 RepID=Q6IJG8_DROME|nr:TPA_inf: HDC14943 [Drosophila melanogaster]
MAAGGMCQQLLHRRGCSCIIFGLCHTHTANAFEALQRGIEDSQRFMTCLFATTIATQLCHMQ